jgi:restriction system protein
VYTKNGKMPKIQYRLHWARTRLKGIRAVDNSARGVWAITDRGLSLSTDQVRDEVKAWQAGLRGKRPLREVTDPDEGDDAGGGELGWKEQLLARLLQVSPGGFERLAQRVLREAGFTNVAVTGKSGDGGIDGLGTYRLSLVSFPIFFQCKRYRGTVGSRDIRDFRGAMVGRGEKGLFITTGTFTRDAQREASRDGAAPIELVDGDQLCELLKQYRLGVVVEPRVVEDVSVRPDFFDDYR